MRTKIKLVVFSFVVALIAANGVVYGQDASVKSLQLNEKYKLAQITRYQADTFVMIVLKDPSFAKNQTVFVVNRQGQELFSCSPQNDIPDVSDVSVHDASLNNNGILGVIATAVGSGNYASVLLVYSLSARKLLHLIRLSPISPSSIGVDESNNFWLLGSDLEKKNRLHQDYNLIYKLSLEGNLLGSFVSRSVFPHQGLGPQKNEPWNRRKGGMDYPWLYANQAGRVYAWFPEPRTVVELNTEGEVLHQTQISEESFKERWVSALMVQPNGQIVGLLQNGLNLLKLDNPIWKTMKPSDEAENQFLKSHDHNDLLVIGADNTHIIVRDRNNNIHWLLLGK